MAYTQKPWLNKLWLCFFISQIAAILLVDAVQFYPPILYQPPSSPFHFLDTLQNFYLTTFADPIVSHPATPGMAWTRLFLTLEMLYLLPMSIYGAWRLGKKGETSGRDELVFLVYAGEFVLTTMTCVNELWWWDGLGMRNALVFQCYGPFLVLSTLLFGDMFLRLWGRLDAADGKDTVKKTQ